jgi:hypothetical protein
VSATHAIEYVVSEDQVERLLLAGLAAKKLNPPSSKRASVILWVCVGLLVLVTIFYWAVLGFDCTVPLLALLNMVLVLGWAIRVRSHRRLRAVFSEYVQKLGSSPVRWTLSDGGMACESALGAREVRWTDIRGITFGHGYWAVAEKSGNITLLPADKFSEQAERFLLAQAREAGATIPKPAGVEADYDDEPR